MVAFAERYRPPRIAPPTPLDEVSAHGQLPAPAPAIVTALAALTAMPFSSNVAPFFTTIEGVVPRTAGEPCWNTPLSTVALIA